MPLPPWLDRLWLWAIGISFCLVAVMWFAFWGSRIGYLTLAAIIAMAFLARRLRRLGDTHVERD